MASNNSHGRGRDGNKLFVAGVCLALVFLAMGTKSAIPLFLIVVILGGSMLWSRWHNPPEAPGFKPHEDDDK